MEPTSENLSHAFPDKLERIFALQRQLNLRIGVDTSKMSPEEKAKWVLNYTRAMSQEIAELVDSVPWKWWAKYQVFNEQNCRVEIVDMMHFLVSLAQVMGMSAEDVFDAYTKKHSINTARQETGYAIKDESDNSGI